MTPSEALKIIEQLVNSVNMNREAWKKLEEALLVIKSLVEKDNK